MPSFQCVHRLNPATVACVSCIHANSKQDFLELTITSSSNSFVGGCILDVTMSEDQEVSYYSLTPKRIRTCVRAMRAVVYVYMCGLCIQGCLVSGSPLHTHVKKCEGGKERWGEPGKMSCHGGRWWTSVFFLCYHTTDAKRDWRLPTSTITCLLRLSFLTSHFLCTCAGERQGQD